MRGDFNRLHSSRHAASQVQGSGGWNPFLGDSRLSRVWGNAPTQQECEVDLQEALEDWILVGLHLRHPLPVIDGIDLNPKEQEVA